MHRRVYVKNNGRIVEEGALLDTGAGVTLVDIERADELGLRLTGRGIQLGVASGTTYMAYETYPCEIYIPDLKKWVWQNLYVPEFPVRVNGKLIIGQDLMRKNQMGLQYQNGTKIWSGTQTRVTYRQSQEALRRTVGGGIIGALFGALIGGLVGGGRGAVVGAFVGGGVGCSAGAISYATDEFYEDNAAPSY